MLPVRYETADDVVLNGMADLMDTDPGHEFSNLLAVIRGHAGVLLADSTDPTANESLEAILRAEARASALAQRLFPPNRPNGQ